MVWPVTNPTPRPAEERDRADDVLRLLVALDRARGDRDVAELLDHLGVRLTPSDIVKPGATQLTWMPSLPSSRRERARERDDRALARHVVEEERHAAEGRARRDVDDLAAAALAHHGHGRAAREEHRRDVDVHHLRHSSSGISVNGRISSDA